MASLNVSIIFIMLSSILALQLQAAPAVTRGRSSTDQFIRSKCNTTDYPRLCIASLSSYAPAINNNPVILADAALNVTLAHARSTSAMMDRLAAGRGPHLPSRAARGAVKDCMETMSDSVRYLRRAMKEMEHGMKATNKELIINDVQTWVSTALTDESTCMEGLRGDDEGVNGGKRAGKSSPRDGGVQSAVRGKVVRVAQLTSNALALIGTLAPSP